MGLRGLLLASCLLLAAQSSFGLEVKTCIDNLSAGKNKLRVKVPKEPLKKLFEGLKSYDAKVSEDVALLVDYSQKSTVKRSYLIDVKSCDVIANEYVIHGGAAPKSVAPVSVSSADGQLKKCLNGDGKRTFMTRPGFMVTAGCHDTNQKWPQLAGNTCEGIKLIGLQSRNNDVFNAGVVLHEHSLIPNSNKVKPVGQGCPAFPAGRLKALLKFDLLQGALVYIHAPQCK